MEARARAAEQRASKGGVQAEEEASRRIDAEVRPPSLCRAPPGVPPPYWPRPRRVPPPVLPPSRPAPRPAPARRVDCHGLLGALPLHASPPAAQKRAAETEAKLAATEARAKAAEARAKAAEQRLAKQGAQLQVEAAGRTGAELHAARAEAALGALRQGLRQGLGLQQQWPPHPVYPPANSVHAAAGSSDMRALGNAAAHGQGPGPGGPGYRLQAPGRLEPPAAAHPRGGSTVQVVASMPSPRSRPVRLGCVPTPLAHARTPARTPVRPHVRPPARPPARVSTAPLVWRSGPQTRRRAGEARMASRRSSRTPRRTPPWRHAFFRCPAPCRPRRPPLSPPSFPPPVPLNL